MCVCTVYCTMYIVINDLVRCEWWSDECGNGVHLTIHHWFRWTIFHHEWKSNRFKCLISFLSDDHHIFLMHGLPFSDCQYLFTAFAAVIFDECRTIKKTVCVYKVLWENPTWMIFANPNSWRREIKTVHNEHTIAMLFCSSIVKCFCLLRECAWIGIFWIRIICMGWMSIVAVSKHLHTSIATLCVCVCMCVSL